MKLHMESKFDKEYKRICEEYQLNEGIKEIWNNILEKVAQEFSNIHKVKVNPKSLLYILDTLYQYKIHLKVKDETAEEYIQKRLGELITV